MLRTVWLPAPCSELEDEATVEGVLHVIEHKAEKVGNERFEGFTEYRLTCVRRCW